MTMKVDTLQATSDFQTAASSTSQGFGAKKYFQILLA
jgi:hypothetical protein